MREFSKKTIVFGIIMIIALPITVVCFVTGNLLFGFLGFFWVVLSSVAYIYAVKGYKVYRLLSKQIIGLEIAQKINLLYQNADDWLMFADDEEVAELRMLLYEPSQEWHPKLEKILRKAKDYKK